MGSAETGRSGVSSEPGGHYHDGSWYRNVECPHVPERTRLEMPNGAFVVCRHDMLPIGWSNGRWVHAFNGCARCREDGLEHQRCATVAEPYLTPQSEEFLAAGVAKAFAL